MKVTMYGTRGSIPISNPHSAIYGGNTTCLRIESECLPSGSALVVDAGSGFVPLSHELLSEKVMKVGVLFTHWHHDHTQGFCLAPHTFIDSAEIRVWGPKEHGVGPNEVLEGLMRSPFFPVDFAKLRHRIKTVPLCHVGTQVLVVHPVGGTSLMDVHRYRDKVKAGLQLPFGQKHFPVEQCLVIMMYKTEHPEYTVSYRFEEGPTGRVFVFLTDHENTASLPRDLLSHVSGAHLLVQDGQYSDEAYSSSKAGFGHGTPSYCASVMKAASVLRLGITHHDPSATDADIDRRVDEARAEAVRLGVNEADVPVLVFGCRDYVSIQV